MAGQYVGEEPQLQRTLVQAMLLAGELTLAQDHMRLFGLQVGGAEGMLGGCFGCKLRRSLVQASAGLGAEVCVPS